MFDRQIIEMPGARRRNAVKVRMLQLAEKRELYLTDVLLVEEPLRTEALEVLDGVGRLGSHIPAPTGQTLIQQFPERLANIRLLTLDPGGVMTLPAWEERLIPGTDQIQRRKTTQRYGADATLPHQIARRLLVLEGWPIRDKHSKGNSTGTVVEWEWLAQRVTRPDADDGLLEVYERLRARGEGVKPAQQSSKTINKTAPLAGVNP